jgi:uncharacterized protein with GYD domain
MAFYLTRFSYTPETWARLTKNPEDRREAARKYIESVGGKLHGFWYGFGTYDGYNLWEAPDNVSMAAVAIAIGGGGALSKIETTPLLTVEETLDALRRAPCAVSRVPAARGVIERQRLCEEASASNRRSTPPLKSCQGDRSGRAE